MPNPNKKIIEKAGYLKRSYSASKIKQKGLTFLKNQLEIQTISTIPYASSPEFQLHHQAFYFLPVIKPGNEIAGLPLHSEKAFDYCLWIL